MKIGFIGCGNMGGALARAVAKSGAEIYLADTSQEKASEVAEQTGGTVSDAESIASSCDFIYIGVKPAGVFSLIGELAPLIKFNTGATVVCMAAGVKIAQIEETTGFKLPIIRIMPNTPVGFGEGMTVAAANEYVSEEVWQAFSALMRPSGRLDRIDEGYIDAASAVSGSGPAFVYMFLNALTEGGVRAGLPRDKAFSYAAQTLIGATTVALEDRRSPEELKQAVCSPGGSTLAGVGTLDEGNFSELVATAVVNTYNKARTLGRK